MKIWVAKNVPGILVPTDDYARGVIRKLKLALPIECEISQPRNGEMHKKFWALVNVVWQSTGQWETPEELVRELKMCLGICEDVFINGFGWVKLLGSISYAKMDQQEFEVFFERALEQLCRMAGNIERESLRNAVLDELSH